MAAQSRRPEARSRRDPVRTVRPRAVRPERLSTLLRRLTDADDRRRLAEPGSPARRLAETEIDGLIRAILDSPDRDPRTRRRT